jgi:hypothetical protein
MKFPKKAVITIAILLGIVCLVAVVFYFLSNSKDDSMSSSVQEESAAVQEAPEQQDTPEPGLTASDTTLGSGFSITYPKEWQATHTGADTPESSTVTQTDETILTSPSGQYQVVFKVQTNIKTSSYCTPDYIQLKYLNADSNALAGFLDGRFVEYVVYFPSFNLYQYHIGLQKNTEAIRGVTLDNNTTCNFMFSEFIPRPSNIPNVPLTYTFLAIRPMDVLNGENLKPGVTEQQVVEKLSGEEYEQAKEIVRSLKVK